jgi:hypothetical protein
VSHHCGGRVTPLRRTRRSTRQAPGRVCASRTHPESNVHRGLSSPRQPVPHVRWANVGFNSAADGTTVPHHHLTLGLDCHYTTLFVWSCNSFQADTF